WILQRRERVQVGEEDEYLSLILQLHDGADRAEIVAHVQDSRRLNPGKYALHRLANAIRAERLVAAKRSPIRPIRQPRAARDGPAAQTARKTRAAGPGVIADTVPPGGSSFWRLCRQLIHVGDFSWTSGISDVVDRPSDVDTDTGTHAHAAGGHPRPHAARAGGGRAGVGAGAGPRRGPAAERRTRRGGGGAGRWRRLGVNR